MLRRLTLARDGLSPAERRVADAVLRQPELVVEGTLRDVAEVAGVSEPTALRFCRSVGYDSFRDFRVAVAQDLAAVGAAAAAETVTQDDTIGLSTDKVFAGALAALRDTRSHMDKAAIEAAARALAKARRIDIYGMGASALVAADAQHKLFRITNVATAYQDAHMQLMAAATLGSDDCAVAISHSGKTRELLDCVDLAREAGATIIAITRTGSPLAEAADIAITTVGEEHTELFTPMTSRITQLVVVDALTVALALLSPRANRDRLGRMTRALSARRVSPRRTKRNEG